MSLGPCILHSRYRRKTRVCEAAPSSSLNIYVFLSPFAQILRLEMLVVFVYGVFINFKSETRSNPCLWCHSLPPSKLPQAGVGLYRDYTHPGTHTHTHNLRMADMILYVLSKQLYYWRFHENWISGVT